MLPTFAFTIATAPPSPVRTSLGFDLIIESGIGVAADTDLIAIPALSLNAGSFAPIAERYLAVIRAAESRGVWVLSVCSGAFALAQAGILDDRRATTHWMHTDQLAIEYPRIAVDPDVLYMEDRGVVTSSGSAAGIDAALHIVLKELGTSVTDVVARRPVGGAAPA